MSRREREIDALAARVAEAMYDADDVAVRQIVAEGAERLREYPGVAWDLLNLAVERGFVQTTAALLDAGAPPEEIDENGGTALMRAAWHGHADVARVLLNAGADPDRLAEDYSDSTDPEWIGRCALYFAWVQGHRDVVELLEPLTSLPVRELAVWAVQNERERRAAEPAPPPPEFRALCRAITDDDPDGVRAALAAGADVNGRDNEGTSPLWLAAAGCRVRTLPILLQDEAEVDAPGEKFGGTALTVAVRLKREAMLVPLLAAGANPDQPDGAGMTAWQMARINPSDCSRVEALERACEVVRGRT